MILSPVVAAFACAAGEDIDINLVTSIPGSARRKDSAMRSFGSMLALHCLLLASCTQIEDADSHLVVRDGVVR